MPAIDRRDTDTARSYAALCDYAAMGAGRSLDKLRQAYGRNTAYVRVLEGWSAKHDWQARCTAYDAAQRAEDDAARALLRAERRAALEDADWTTGEAIRAQALSVLEEVPKFVRKTERETMVNGETIRIITLALVASPGVLAQALKVASELQRLSVGVATEQIDTHQTIEITYVNDSPDDETPA